jgi:hypothetical protein
MDYNLLSVQADAKTIKGEAQGYLTGILYLAPHDLAGKVNVCPWSTQGCRDMCLFTAGHGGMNSVQLARIRKTMLFFEDRSRFLEAIDEDIFTLKRIACKRGMIPCVRLNGTSDIAWEQHMDLTAYGLQFYDYTKNPNRMRHFLDAKAVWHKNYHLTFSKSENENIALGGILGVGNMAVVFDTKKGKDLPTEYKGIQVIDGDLSDLRFLDPKGVIVGLRAKGKARKDTSGFVVKV